MRLFVAVRPDAAAVTSLSEALRQLPADVPVRWGRPEQWHLTLCFLGEVEPRVVPELEERLIRAAGRAAPLTPRLQGAGAFPSPRRARVLWAGVQGDREALIRLAATTTAAAARTGIAVERRPYRPHLTLGRVREQPGADLTPVVAALGGYAGPPWVANAVELVSSRLGPRPEHETIARLPLGPGGGS